LGEDHNNEGDDNNPEDNTFNNDDDDDDDEDNDDDNHNNNPMPPRRVPPVPTAAPAAARPAADGGIGGLVQAMGNVRIRPPFQPFNFNFRFPCIFMHTVALADGHKIVMGDYLVPTLHVSRFKVNVSANGEEAILSMALPKTFVDMNARSLVEVSTSNRDEQAFWGAYRKATHDIKSSGLKLDNVHATGQRDTLPFPCQQLPVLMHVLHTGDDLLFEELSNNFMIDSNAKHQMFAFLRVKFISLELSQADDVYVRPQVNLSPRHSNFGSSYPSYLAQQAAAQQAAAQQAAAQQAAAQQAAAQQVAAQQFVAAQQQAAQQAAAQQAAMMAQQAEAQQVEAQQQAAAQQAAAAQQPPFVAAAGGGLNNGGINAEYAARNLVPNGLYVEQVCREGRANSRERNNRVDFIIDPDL
jgi:hypothetical protein